MQAFEVLRWGFSVWFLSVGVSCLLDWLGKPVFVSHKHLWLGLSFFDTGICVRSVSLMACSAVGIRVSLFVFALLAHVSGYQYISVISNMLCTCWSSASSLEIQTRILRVLRVHMTTLVKWSTSCQARPTTALLFRDQCVSVVYFPGGVCKSGVRDVRSYVFMTAICVSRTYEHMKQLWFCRQRGLPRKFGDDVIVL